MSIHSMSLFTEEEVQWIKQYYQQTCNALYHLQPVSMKNLQSNFQNQSTVVNKSFQNYPFNTQTTPTRVETSNNSEECSLHSPELSKSAATSPVSSVASTSNTSSPKTSPIRPKIIKNNNSRMENSKQCSQCFAKVSPIWRRGQNGCLLCNKCGLKWKRNEAKECKFETK